MRRYKLTKPKRAFLIILCVGTMITALAGCSVPKYSSTSNEESSYGYSDDSSPNEDNYTTEPQPTFNDYTESNSYVYDDKDSFSEIKAYYEYDDDELNSIIDQIKSVEFNSPDETFISYNLSQLPSMEMEAIRRTQEPIKDSVSSTNYDWYEESTGNINKDLLYNKLVNNTKNNGVSINQDMQNVIRCFCDNLKKAMDNHRKKHNDFDFSIALSNINDLSFSMEEIDNIAAYDLSNNVMIVNTTIDYSELDFCVVHETDHLIMNKKKKNSSVYSSSFSVDTVTSENDDSSLFYDFAMEYYADSMAADITSGVCNNYNDEKTKLKKLSSSTSISIDKFETIYVEGDLKKVINLFEPELQDFNYVCSTMEGLDISCGYGNVPYNCNDEDSWRTSCYYYSEINLIKNKYIHIIKQLYNNSISGDEAKEISLDYKKQMLYDEWYTYSESSENKEAIEDAISQLDNIFYSYIYSI